MHEIHHHVHNTGKVLKWSLAITILFVIGEFVAGIQAHSLALLSDAGHNFTDALALLLAAFGYYLQSKPADETKTYGYHRGGVLAAFVNALTLILLAVYIFYEAVQRFIHPEVVHEITMLVVAAVGLVVNVAIMWGLHKERDDLNIRAAFIHMLGDALGSIGIVVGAIVIGYAGWQWIDPLLSVLIGSLIVWTAWDIVKESLNILLEGLPRGIELPSVVRAMCAVEGVLGVHDLHIWSLGSQVHALSCHVMIDDLPPSASENILRAINGTLREKYKIRHTTVQFEHAPCPVSQNGCPLPGTHERIR